MAFSSIVKFFLPKDKVFYGLFEEVSLTLVEMATVFAKAVNSQDIYERDALLKSLETLEHKNDETTHRIFIELGRNFITPFDREDIHYLTTSLDDVADYIWGAAKRIVNYGINDKNDDYLRGFGEIIAKSINALHTSVHELRNMKNLRAITDACVLINSLENDGDDLLDKAMMELFSAQINAVELIKKKDLYQMLETVTDKCEDAANVIESIIIKYA